MTVGSQKDWKRRRGRAYVRIVNMAETSLKEFKFPPIQKKWVMVQVYGRAPLFCHPLLTDAQETFGRTLDIGLHRWQKRERRLGQGRYGLDGWSSQIFTGHTGKSCRRIFTRWGGCRSSTTRQSSAK